MYFMKQTYMILTNACYESNEIQTKFLIKEFTLWHQTLPYNNIWKHLYLHLGPLFNKIYQPTKKAQMNRKYNIYDYT